MPGRGVGAASCRPPRGYPRVVDLRAWFVVGAIAIALSVAIAWLFDTWLGVLPLVAVIPFVWRRGGRD